MAAYLNNGGRGVLLACSRIAMLRDKMWHRYTETRKAAYCLRQLVTELQLAELCAVAHFVLPPGWR